MWGAADSPAGAGRQLCQVWRTLSVMPASWNLGVEDDACGSYPGGVKGKKGKKSSTHRVFYLLYIHTIYFSPFLCLCLSLGYISAAVCQKWDIHSACREFDEPLWHLHPLHPHFHFLSSSGALPPSSCSLLLSNVLCARHSHDEMKLTPLRLYV